MKCDHLESLTPVTDDKWICGDCNEEFNRTQLICYLLDELMKIRERFVRIQEYNRGRTDPRSR